MDKEQEKDICVNCFGAANNDCEICQRYNKEKNKKKEE